MSRRTTTGRAGAAALVAALLVTGTALAGCSDGSGDPKGGSSPSTSASPSESGSASPSVAPATGAELTIERATMHAPDGWQPTGVEVSFQKAAAPTDGSKTGVSLIQFPGDDKPLDALAAEKIGSGSFPQKPKAEGTVTIDGQEAYKIAGQISPSIYWEEYGTYLDGFVVTVTFSFETTVWSDATKRRQAVDSALATLRWVS